MNSVYVPPQERSAAVGIVADCTRGLHHTCKKRDEHEPDYHRNKKRGEEEAFRDSSAAREVSPGGEGAINEDAISATNDRASRCLIAFLLPYISPFLLATTWSLLNNIIPVFWRFVNEKA